MTTDAVAERARIIACNDFASVLSTASTDDDYQRVAVALGGAHLFAAGSAAENKPRRKKRQEKMRQALRELGRPVDGRHRVHEVRPAS